MKKIILLAIILCSTTLSFGQQDGDITLGVYTGFSLTGATYKAITSLVESDSLTSDILSGSNLPVFGAAVDYRVSDEFTIGALVGVQRFSANITERAFNFGDTTYGTTPVTINMNRIYIGIVPTYQYETINENVELYSAVRVGFVFWQGNFDAENSDIEALSGFGGGRPALSIVALGGRYYFNPNFAFNFEIATGAPAMLSFGLNYKL